MSLLKQKIYSLLVLTVLVTGIFVFTANHKVQAQADALLKFEGKVTNTDGTELADGNYDFNFNLYDSATGGASLWSEDLTAATRFSASISLVGSSADGIVYTYNGESATTTLRLGQYLTNETVVDKALIVDYDTALNTITVASSSSIWTAGDTINNRPYVEGGVIDINLGSVSDLSGIDFSEDLFLEVRFNGETMQPRKIITTEARAFDTTRVGGKTEDELATLIENEIIEGEWTFNNAVNIATSSSDTALSITQNGSGNIVEFKTGASTSLAVLADGRVQIGDYYFPTEQAGVGGYVLKTDSFGNLSWEADIAGTGGGSGLWASTTGNLVYGADPAQILVIGNNATTTLDGQQFEVNGSSLFDMVNITNQEEIRFYDADSSNYVAIKATGTIVSNFVLSLPGSLGLAGQALLTDANGNLSWGTPTGFTYVNAGAEGQLPYYRANGSTLSATSSLFLTPSGYFGIGTTSPYKMLAVEGGGAFDEICLGGDCISNWSGASTLGGSGTAGQVAVWANANTLEASSTLSVVIGGTGRSSWTPYAIPYISGTTTIGEIPVGTANYLLAVNATANGYTWVDTGSVGVDTNDQVKVDSGAVAGYLGVGSSDGVFRNDSTLSRIDGGDYITIGVANDAIGNTQLEYDTGQALTTASSPTFNNLTLSGLDFTGFSDAILTIVSGSVATTSNNIANWDAAYASTTIYDAMYASSTNWDSGYNIVDAGHDNWDFAYASTTVYDAMYASSTYWDIAYNWDDHADQNYFSTSSSVILEIIHGGTGADNLSDAQDNLGLTIGTNVQAWNQSLDDISGLATTSNLFMVANGTSWGVQSTSTVRTNLGLDDIYDYAISDSDVYGKVWISSGVGLRGQWMATNTLAINFNDIIGTLAVNRGGTGKDIWNNQGILYATGTELSQIATGTHDQLLSMNATGDGYLWVSAGSVGVDTNDRVGVDSSAVAGYLGISSGDGVIRTDSTLSYADGGNWITIGVANDAIGNTQLEYDTGQNLTTADSPTFAGLYLSGFDDSILIIDGGEVSTTTNNIANWDLAYSWNNHANAGYFATSSGGILEILYGGTGAASAAGALENLDLDQIHKFAINATGTLGWIWQSDGDGRGNWVATGTLGIASGDATQAKLVGTTTATFDGSFSTSTKFGYDAANQICSEEFPGSFFCRTYDILVSIEQDDISSWGGSAWIAEGPPGYTSNSNDCKGWTDNNSTVLGAFWAFDSSGGGMGWLTNCSGEKPIACCGR